MRSASRLSPFALALSSIEAHAAEAKTIRICFAEWPPYIETVDHRVEGSVAERLRRAGAALSSEVELTAMTVPRCREEVLAGRQDALFPQGKAEGGLVRSTTTLLHAEYGFFTLKTSPITELPDGLAGRTVVIPLGGDPTPAVKRGAAVLELPNGLNIQTVLAAGRADLGLGDIVTLERHHPEFRVFRPAIMVEVGLGLAPDADNRFQPLEAELRRQEQVSD